MELISKIDPAQIETELFRYFKNPVILDTGPLVFLLIGLCDPSKREAKDIWQGHTREEFDLLLKIVRNFKGITIIPQILVECTHLLKRDNNADKYRFLLSQIIQPLKEFGEVYIEKNIIFSYSDFPRFGSTDIGIIECSKQNNNLIITEDSNFKLHCSYTNIPCLNFNELRPSTWK